jgi:hypothetical protein
MATDPPASASSAANAAASAGLSRPRLARVLGLPPDASLVRIERALPRLLARLRDRLERADGAEAVALRRELAELEESVAAVRRSAESKGRGRSQPHVRRGGLGVLLATLFVMGLLIAYAAGVRVTRLDARDAAPLPTAARQARLVLEGDLAGATLRVLDPDRQEVLLTQPADGARVRLDEGRYALEVLREDCPDRWTRSVWFDAGSTRRFEPEICGGEGELVVRSNLLGDRLLIDGRDVGGTGADPHALGVGDHEVRVEKAGYRPFVGQVRIQPGERVELRAELVADEDASRVGRPMPVDRQAPSDRPKVGVPMEQLDLAALREEMGDGTEDFEIDREDLFPKELGRPATSDGGSTAWHDRVSADLLARYDLDGSGHLDRVEESEAIPCRVWRGIEQDFDGGGLGLTMARYYGFDGTEWHPHALGFVKSLRSAVYERMKECGLRE